ncbi:MAG: CCA tRNA nucleotidyltransferase [Anaerolineales bacterium]|nr:CCA tRNA nucleotidyltransferase [Anaerolineales bacterium]
MPVSRSADLVPYAGRWVAYLGGQVVAQGGTPQQALSAAKAARYKENPEVFYVPTDTPFNFSPILERVRRALPDDMQVYLVGGAVRDALLSRKSHDYDFVLGENALQVARRVANKIGAAYFPLDVERATARVIYTDENGDRQILDFAALRGPDLDADLKDRDFTINAMAVDVRDLQALFDPLGGASDLQTKTLRACSSESFRKDPVRILRAVRLAAAYKLSITPDTREQIRASISGLETVSPERLRDELLNILAAPRVGTSIRALDILGALPNVLPELSSLKGLAQSPPHTQDAWNHTLDTLSHLERLLHILAPVHDPNASGSLVLGLAVMRLGRYREQLGEMLNTSLVTDRSLRPLLFLAALYHDIGKPQSQKQESESGRIRFLEHERIGAEIAAERGRALHLSNAEVDWLETAVQHHMRPTWLAREAQGPSSRAIYRFFRDTKLAGAAVCLLSLADLLGTYGAALPQERWGRQLDVARALLEAWWEHREEKVDPPALISGNDIISEFDLTPGPLIGEVLEALREAQAEGQVGSRKEALDFVGDYLKERTIS